MISECQQSKKKSTIVQRISLFPSRFEICSERTIRKMLVEKDLPEAIDEGKIASFKATFMTIKKAVTIEPIMCLYLVNLTIRDLVLNNLLLEMSCRVNQSYNETVCQAIITSTHGFKNLTSENSNVQEHINDMLGWYIPIHCTVPIVLLLFFGTYSDTHKIRKPFLLAPIFGELIATMCCIICAIFKDQWPVEIGGLAHYIVPSLFGSLPMINMAGFAYIADISTPEMCIIRIAILQISINVCKPIGMALGGVLFNIIGYIPSLIIGLVLLLFGILYGTVIVKESKESTCPQTESNSLCDIFNPVQVVETIKLLTKYKGTQRIDIIFVLIINFITTTVFAGKAINRKTSHSNLNTI